MGLGLGLTQYRVRPNFNLDTTKSKCMTMVQDLWLRAFFDLNYRVLYSCGQMPTLAIRYYIAIAC